MRGFLAGFVGHRMAGFDHRDAVGQQPVLVARDDEAVERRLGRPVLLDRERHRSGGLAGADDQRAAFGRLRQMRRHDLERIGGGERGVEAAEQNRAVTWL